MGMVKQDSIRLVIRLGLECDHVVAIRMIPVTQIMEVAGLKFASGGTRLQISWRIWAKGQKVKLLAVWTITDRTPNPIANGKPLCSKVQIQDDAALSFGMAKDYILRNGQENSG